MKALAFLLFVLFFFEVLGKKIYIRKTAYGSKNGTSWENAFAITSLSSQFALSSGGDLIYIRGDEGNYTYTSTINLNNGGSVGNRVRVQGVDVNLNPAFATFVGSRKPWILPSNPEQATNATDFGGNKLFEVRAKSFEMSHLGFVNVGYVYAFNNNITTDVLLENIQAYNVRSFVDQDATVTLTNITIRKVRGTGFSKKFIRFQGESNNNLIEDCDANSGRQAYDNFSGGVVFDGRAHTIVVRNCNFRNGHDTQGNDTSKYWNTDGYSSERGNHDLLFENCQSSGWTDGGHDHKAENVTLKNCVSWDNKRNYRFWGRTNTLINTTSIEPHNRGGIGGQSHIFLAENAIGTWYGGIVQHNASKTIGFYLESNSKLTLVGVQEVYPPTVSANEYKASGASLIREAAVSALSSDSQIYNEDEDESDETVAGLPIWGWSIVGIGALLCTIAIVATIWKGKKERQNSYEVLP